MKFNKLIIPMIAMALLSACNNNPTPSNSVNSGDSTVSVDSSTSQGGESITPSTPSITPTNYYQNITASSGAPLLAQLHDLITSTHTYYTSYNDCKYSSNLIHTDKYDDSHLTEFYSQSAWQIEDANATSSGHLNREHVWPKANSNGLWNNETVGGGADLHHVRPTEYNINSTRGNNEYGVVSNRDSNKVYATTTSSTKVHAGYLGGGVFEPLDSVKGDVARIVMYVYTHYNSYKNLPGATTNGSGNPSYFGSLPISSNVSGGFSLLINWNNSDPVSQQEIDRNNYLFNMEHNRNPFIDHPEYATSIWAS